MPDQIAIQGLRLFGKHGVHEWEKQYAQPFDIDLSLSVDLRRDAETDNLDDTVSYVDIIEAVKGIVMNEQHNLIERLADRIAAVALSDPRVLEVDVTVRKPHAAVNADVDFAAVFVHRP
jgi:dihydroneopterin aldolase